MTEEEIVERIKNQDEAGLPLLAEKYEKLLVYIISGILGNRVDDIEECVNDTYLKFWKNVSCFDFERASLATYLKVIARNTALNRLRDIQRHEERRYEEDISAFADTCADGRQNLENQVLRNERIVHLNAVIHELPEKERELMLRKYFYLQSSKTIAKAMKTTVNAVDTKLSRLRAKMRSEFGDWEG